MIRPLVLGAVLLLTSPLPAQTEGGPAERAHALLQSGITDFRAGRLDTALIQWETGVALADSAGATEELSSLLNALAIGHTARGDVEAALPVYERTLALREDSADTAGLARTWGNLAQAYTNMGRLAEALAATTEEARWRELADSPRGRLAMGLRRGTILGRMGRMDEALLQNRLTYEDARAGTDQEGLGLATLQLGESLMDTGKPAEALPYLESAAALLDSTGHGFQALFAEQSRIACLLLMQRPQEALRLAGEVAPRVQQADQLPLLTVIRRMQGQALLDLGRLVEAEKVLLEAQAMLEERVRDQEDERSVAGIFQSSGELYAILAEVRLRQDRLPEAFDTVERGRAPGFRGQAGAEPATIAELQTELRATATTLILFNDPGQGPLRAFVLGPENLATIELGEFTGMAADARSALQLLAAGEPLEVCRPALARLEDRLVPALLNDLAPGTRRLAVVPPSFLTGFPLGVLQDEDGQAIGDRYPISYLPGATALISLTRREGPPAGIQAFADPATGSVPNGRLPLSPARSRVGVALPEARREVDALTRDPASRFEGAGATAGQLRKALENPLGVLHLATHAVVDPLDGGRSALVLAGLKDGTAEEVTARDIAGLPFAGDLVFLSGCSTFGRHRVLGEGWFGLPRSFLAAGARSVISTLWDVDDRGARIFVTAFYEALGRGLDRDMALREARAVCRGKGLPPRDWAAFVLSGVGAGEVPALQTSRPEIPAILWWGLGAAALGVFFWRRR